MPHGLSVLVPVMLAACNPPPADDPTPPTEPQWAEAFDTTDAGFLSAVWGSAADDVFIVGGQPDRGEVYHFDGTDWSPMDIPETPILIWVYGLGSDDVFAVGERGSALHYDGATWTEMATGTDSDLWGVWGDASDDVWAVGGEIGTGPPVLLHFDGDAWSAVAVPTLDRASTALLKVWGTTATNVFAVGQLGVILGYDGTNWAQVPSGTSEDLISLWGTGPDHIVAVGGRSNGEVAVYDGSTWTSQTVAPIVGLNGVFMEQPDEALIVGLIGTAATLDPDSLTSELETTGTSLTLHAVWGDRAGRAYAVGGRATGTPYQGVALIRSTQ
jgi:hypothetical protein